mgnify:CR=1 FL=1
MLYVSINLVFQIITRFIFEMTFNQEKLIFLYKINLTKLYQIILQKQNKGQCVKDLKKQYDVYSEIIKD